MCGIVGYVGEGEAQDIILEGLARLEYRGYDSAGISLLQDGALATCKRVGKLAVLRTVLETTPLRGRLGIGHTRWATHGAPAEENAHPHWDVAQDIAVVHNGIIENFQELRQELEATGIVFRSATDSEVLPHLIQQYYQGDLIEAVRLALQRVRGAYAIGVLHRGEPEVLVGARQGSPLILGLGQGEYFIGSDASAVVKHTRQVIYLNDGELCKLTPAGYHIIDMTGAPARHTPSTIDWDPVQAEKEGYPHYMLKEIFQQPEVLRHALLAYVDSKNNIEMPDLGLDSQRLAGLRRIVIVACGTAWHAGLVGKYMVEQFARIPVEVDLASEFRYGNRVLDADTLVIPVTQSGETADTLEAVRIARTNGAPVIGIVNVVGSSIARSADGVIYTHAGPEIGVASTKAYTSQLCALALFSLYMGRIRNTVTPEDVATQLTQLREIPGKLEQCLERADAIAACARKDHYMHAKNAMFIGRGVNYPSAMEGALKLKEISYIHVEGYAAGEMKHGPIALVTPELPVVCLAPQGSVYEKVRSNLDEVRARGGVILSIATEGDDNIKTISNDVLYIPACAEMFSPLLVAAPLQLIAYYIACGLGRDVDQPRNLAKSVTVE